MMEVAVLGKTLLFSLGMVFSPDRKKMTIVFSLAHAVAWRGKWSCLVHEPGQRYSLQPVQSVRYVQSQLCKRNI